MNPAKTLLLAALLAYVTFFPIGCSGGGSTGASYFTNDSGGSNGAIPAPTASPTVAKNGFSETEWVKDPAIRLEPHNVAAIYLEPCDGTPNPNRPDSGGSDYDVIPLVIPQENIFSYSIDPNDTTTTLKKAVMLDSAGNKVFTIDAQTPGARVYLAAGNYYLEIYSGYLVNEKNEDHRIVFLHSAQTKDAVGRYNPADLNRLLSTNSCPHGDLSAADLSAANLADADLTNANLTRAILTYASLFEADLTDADLSSADLTNAYLGSAFLTRANLTCASLWGAYLTNAFLSSAELSSAELSYANLFAVKLTNADLSGADLSHAYLHFADLSNADLTNADLFGAELPYANLSGAVLSNTTMPDGLLNSSGTNHPQHWPF